MMAHSNRDNLYSAAFLKFFRKSIRSRSSWIFILSVLGILSLFQIALFIIIKYASRGAELQVAQASLDAKLFQDPKIEEHLDSESVFGISNASPKTFVSSQYFCGFPVPKDDPQAGDRSNLIGSVVLIKGGMTPVIENRDLSSLNGKNLSVSARDFNIYASVFCAKQLISNLPNPTLSRYMTFLERAVFLSLTKTEKVALNSPNFCASQTKSGGDPTAHILVRIFAIANQVATTYSPPLNSADILDGSIVRLFAATSTPQTELESLALLTTILTTWAGNDENKFQSYLNAFKESLELMPNSKMAVRNYKWLEKTENSRFCVSSETLSCTCPRQLLAHSVVERRRTRLMASLRREATSVHSLLPPAVHSLSLTVGADTPSKFDWPYRISALLSEALCNQTVPLPSTTNVTHNLIKICEKKESEKEATTNCVSEALVQRLWEITSYAERKLNNSSAQWELAKFASFPFLRQIERVIAKISSNKDKNTNPWLQVYAGQPDSIYLLLKALNVTVGNIDYQRSVGRLVIEMHGVKPQQGPPSTNLRFLLDGMDISESLKPIGLCEGKPLICPAAKFVNYLKSSKFWGPILDAHQMNSSEDAFQFICNSEDFRTLAM